MKFFSPQLLYFFSDREVRTNVRALLKYLGLVFLVVLVFAVMFHFMMRLEGQEHSWFTGFYWALTVMTTLGFGDITFHTDLGRFFSMIVLLTGIVMLLIVLPFAFIRFFYAPWLEAQIHLRAPRNIPPGTHGHVIICVYDAIAPGLIERLKQNRIPYFVIEPDPSRAYERYINHVSVVTGDPDARTTYETLQAGQARLVVANDEDTVNTNITLTVRSVTPDVPIVALARHEESIDVLELSGANHVLPLKRWLGEQLANRVQALHARAQIIGHYKDVLIADLPVHRTPLANRTVEDLGLDEKTGISVTGVWDRGRIQPVTPDTYLTDSSVLVTTGTRSQFQALNEVLTIYDVNHNPVLIIGGGSVGAAAARCLQEREIPVHVIEKDPSMSAYVRDACDRVFLGDAADYNLIDQAGVRVAPSVILTTNDDAMNIYLASYCRRLNPDLRIVSRITHERNTEAIHRAGADLVLSYAWLGGESILSILEGRELTLVSEGVDLFTLDLPPSLAGKTLAASEIDVQTGLHIVAIDQNGQILMKPAGSTQLEAGATLIAIGTTRQRQQFIRHYASKS